MITKRIPPRRDKVSSAKAVLRYGEGLKKDRTTGELLNKSHRTRLSNFGLVDDGVYQNRSPEEMLEIIELAAKEMQACCSMNTRAAEENRIAHFLFSFDQTKPSEAVLRDVEDSMMAALGLQDRHWVSFTHSDSGHWHLHLIASRIDKEKHTCNELWQDQTIRDRVAREIEIRHGLPRDNGLHEIDEQGRIVQVPKHERMKRKGLKSIKTDKAQSVEIHSGEKTFQAWAEEIRLGDRLKHAKSWLELHATAAAYGCEVKQKGAGFVICPQGEKGGIQLSRLGLKGLQSRFGEFQAPRPDIDQASRIDPYKPAPVNEKGAGQYSAWRAAKKAFQPFKSERINELRERHLSIRKELKENQRRELREIRASASGDERFSAVSVAKMNQAIQLTALSDQFKQERRALYKDLAEHGPGNTFREYLVRQAQMGDNASLGLARAYGMGEATTVLRDREVFQFRIRAVIAGNDYFTATRLRFAHHIGPSGSVIYQLGGGRQIIDSAIARQIQLNDMAATDPQAIEAALRFAVLKFGTNLNLTGPAEFQKLAVQIAVRERMGVNFTDPALEAYRLKLIEQQHSVSTRHSKENHHASHHRIERLRQTPPAHIRDRLYDMPLGDLVHNAGGDVVPLRTDVPSRLEQPKERNDPAVQRTTRSLEGDAADGRAAGKGAGAGNDGAGDQVSLTSQATAHELAKTMSKELGKPIVKMNVASNVVATVLHVADDGVVLDLGRSMAVLPNRIGQDVGIGSKVTVNGDGRILLLQKSRGIDKDR